MRRLAPVRGRSAILLLTVGLVAAPPAWGASRQVLGTLAIHGEVRAREAGEPVEKGTRVETSGAPLLERTSLAVGDGGAAVLAMSGDGLVGLRAGSRATVEAREGTAVRVRLEAGEALIRFPAGSRVTLMTPTVSLRAERVIQVSTDGAAEATARILPDGRTVVRVGSGKVRAEGAAGALSVVAAGEEATFAPGTAATVTAASTEIRAAPAGGKSEGSWMTDPVLLGLIGATVAGGTVGGLVAGGVIGDDDDDDDESLAAGGGGGGGGAGSPFRLNR